MYPVHPATMRAVGVLRECSGHEDHQTEEVSLTNDVVGMNR